MSESAILKTSRNVKLKFSIIETNNMAVILDIIQPTDTEFETSIKIYGDGEDGLDNISKFATDIIEAVAKIKASKKNWNISPRK